MALWPEGDAATQPSASQLLLPASDVLTYKMIHYRCWNFEQQGKDDYTAIGLERWIPVSWEPFRAGLCKYSSHLRRSTGGTPTGFLRPVALVPGSWSACS